MTIIKPQAGEPKLGSVSFTAPDDLMQRVDDEMFLRRVRSRSEIIRLLLEEGLWRAGARRKAGKAVEVRGGEG